MTDPQIVCPKCRTEIKLTESLAEPLVAETRRRFEQQLAAREIEFGRREAKLKEAHDELARARESVDEQVATKLLAERSRIAEVEASRARAAMAAEISERDRYLSEMRQLLAERGEKLAEAQKAQAEILRKERDLDDAKRELELTVEKQVQESLVSVRNKARAEAEDGFKSEDLRKGGTDRGHAAAD